MVVIVDMLEGEHDVRLSYVVGKKNKMVDKMADNDQNKQDSIVDDEKNQLIDHEVDTFLFHKSIPDSLKRSFRLDTIPNIDPVELLFTKIPPPTIDDENMSITRQTKIDKAFITILWGFVNSDLEAVVVKSKSPFARHLWWLGRIAFSLGESGNFNSIKNYFMQMLASMTGDVEAAGEPKDTTDTRVRLWVRYCAWISQGRGDDCTVVATRAGAQNMDETAANKSFVCSVCGADIRGRSKSCGWCAHPAYRSMNSIRFCSEACMKIAYPEHKKHCTRRRNFFRACEMFQAISHRFEVATFTGFARVLHQTVAKLPKREYPPLRENRDVIVSPTITTKDLWTGGSVFSEDAQRVIKGCKGAEHFGLVHYDMGQDIYMQLKPLIRFTLKGFCDQISIIHGSMRNARDMIHLGQDATEKDKLPQTVKGKNPMFHPHSVLYLRLKDSGEEFILDLQSNIFGWRANLISYDVFVRCRLANVVSTTDIYEGDHLWAGHEELGLRQARDEVLTELLERFKVFNRDISKASRPEEGLSTFFQICQTKDDRFEAYRDQILTHADACLADITKRIRDENNYRLYIVYDANPYSHTYRYGVTVTEEERDFYAPIWLSDKEYDDTIGPYANSTTATDSNGHETTTMKLTQLWMARMTDSSRAACQAKKRAAAALTSETAQLYGLGNGITADLMAKIQDTWRNRLGPRLFTGEIGPVETVGQAIDAFNKAKIEMDAEDKEDFTFADAAEESKIRHMSAMRYWNTRRGIFRADAAQE